MTFFFACKLLSQLFTNAYTHALAHTTQVRAREQHMRSEIGRKRVAKCSKGLQIKLISWKRPKLETRKLCLTRSFTGE